MANDQSFDQPSVRHYEVGVRAVTIRDHLSRDEMNVKTGEGHDVVFAAEYEGHLVSLQPAQVPYPTPPGKTATKPPSGHVKYDQNHWGRRARGQEFFALPKLLLWQEYYQGAAPVLSDVLCGIDPGQAMSHWFGGVESTYATAVVEIPGDETQRRGIILLSVTGPTSCYANTMKVRVVGESRSYAGLHQYDASATAQFDTTAGWIDDIDTLALEVTERVLAGAPASRAFPNDTKGARGPQCSTFREWSSGIYLTDLECAIGAQFAAHVDTQNAVTEDLQWAESGPTAWRGISELHQEREDASSREESLLHDLALRGLFDSRDEQWIFRPEVPFETVRDSLLF